jgi:hypothetical protein
MAAIMGLDLREQPDLAHAKNRQAMVGTLGLVAERVRSYVDAGIDYPVFMLPASSGREVLASLAKLGNVIAAG